MYFRFVKSLMSRRILFAATFLALVLSGVGLVKSTEAARPAAQPFIRTIKQKGQANLHSGALGPDKVQTPELNFANLGDSNRVNRSFTRSSSGKAPVVSNPRT